MKKLIFVFLMLIIAINTGFRTKPVLSIKKQKKLVSFIITKNARPSKKVIKFKNRIKVDATYYNPVKGECDSNPLETASQDIIDLKKLKNKEIRWIACSRNLLKRWGGKIKYNTVVYVNSKNPEVKGYWIVKDTMNKRFKDRIDFLTYNRVKGDITDVTIQFN